MSNFKDGDHVLIPGTVRIAGGCVLIGQTLADEQHITPLRGPFWIARDTYHRYRFDRINLFETKPTCHDGMFLIDELPPPGRKSKSWPTELHSDKCTALFGFCPKYGECLKIEGAWRVVKETDNA